MAAPDIILVTGKGYLSRFEPGLQTWHQVIPKAGDPDNATLVRLMILQNSDGFNLKAVHDVDGSEVLFCNFADTIVSGKSPDVLNLTHRDGKKYCMQFMQKDEGTQFQMILKSAFEESRRKSAKPYSSGNKLGGGAAMAAVNPPIKGMEAPRSPMGATSGENIGALIDSLKKALASGDVAGSREVAGNLAQLKVKTNMMVESVGDVPPGRPGTIKLNVNIEDRVTSGGKVILTVRPNETIAALKRKMFIEYKFPVQVQRWIMGRRIPKDNETLFENGIGVSGGNVYLYLVSADQVGVTKRQAELERSSVNQPAGAANMPQTLQSMDRRVPAPTYPPSYMDPPSYSRQQPSTLPPDTYSPGGQAGFRTLQPPPPPARPRNTSGGDGYVTMHPRRVAPMPTAALSKPKKPTAEQVGWHCPICTLINPPTFPGCRACSQERPADYQVPPEGSYIMDEDEIRRKDEVKRNEDLMAQLERSWQREADETRAANLQEMLATESRGLIPNTEEFDCLICYSDVQPGHGVVLRDCLHTFCKDCLGEHIKASTEPVIMCPYGDGEYTCPEALQEREIKALVTNADFKKYLDRGLTTAEAQSANSFHCKTADCPGFCFFDDNNNFFKCPVCSKENCLTCKAIHEGMNCKQYQEDLKRRASNDDAARKTQEALETMVRNGEAIRCPKCGIVVQKKDGCDWIRCTMCKVEICWVTSGLRWGPGGTGDVSGGCRCNVGGKRCHPKCANCH